MHILYVSSVVDTDVSTDQTSYTVLEGDGQLEVMISITSGQLVSGLECQIEVVTNAGSAVGELMITT